MNGRMHRDFRIDERVWFDIGDGVKRHGQVIGIASENPTFVIYIILLDEPIKHPEHANQKPWRGIALPGLQLKSKTDIMA